MTDQPAELGLEDAHRVAVARELTAAAGVPLRPLCENRRAAAARGLS